MSWLNLNQSLNSLKGQITNFASEVLSEAPGQESSEGPASYDTPNNELERKCHDQQLEIAALKTLNEELEATLQSERLARNNGVKEEASSWYWDTPASSAAPAGQLKFQELQEQISNVNENGPHGMCTEIKDELIRLREENKNLTTNLVELDTQHQLAMERLLGLKKELQKNFELLKQEHEELKGSNDRLASDRQSFFNKIAERDKQLEILKTEKSDYDTLHHKYINLEKVHSLLKENAEKFQEENQELHEEVFKLQEQVTKLEHEIEVTTKHSEMSNMVPREIHEELLKELNDLKDRRNSNDDQLDTVNIDDNAKSVIENLKREIVDLKHKLLTKSSDFDHKAIQSDKIMQLFNKYISFDLPVDYTGEMPSTEGNVVLKKLEVVFKTCSTLKKEVASLEHKLSGKNHNISHLQTQIDDLSAENDFLTTDLQHYESEMNNMRKNNDFLINEIAALKNTSKLQPIMETHEDNLAKLESELDNCNKLNKDFETQVKRIQKQLDGVKTEKLSLQESLTELKQKYTSMLSELDSVKTQTKAVEELEHTSQIETSEKIKVVTDEIDDLKTRLLAANAKNEQLSIDNHITENDKVLLIKDVEDLKHALEDTSNMYKDLKSTNENLKQQVKVLEVKLNEALKTNENIENEKSRLAETISVLEIEKLNCSVQISNLHEQQTRMKTIIEDNNNEVAQLQETIHKLTTELDVHKAAQRDLFVEDDALQINLNECQRKEQELLDEISSLKNSSKSETEILSVLQETRQELKAKHIQNELLSSEIHNLKEELQKNIEKNIKIETELSDTDRKINHLEQEFDRLLSDLNDKDTIIEGLNASIARDTALITEMKSNVTELTTVIDIKNAEILNLTKTNKDSTQTIEELNIGIEKAFQEVRKLSTEKEEVAKQLFNLQEEIATKNFELSNITSNFKKSEQDYTTYKALIDGKDEEINKLNKKLIELSEQHQAENTLLQNHNNCLKEQESLGEKVTHLQNSLATKETEMEIIKMKSEQLEKTCVELNVLIENATREKAELINLVNIKHNESIQYHTEIQRLNQVLLEQTNEFKKIVGEKDKNNTTENCSTCVSLKHMFTEKDKIILELNLKASNYDKVIEELHSANETLKSLKERCENLDKSLAIQLENVKRLTAENTQLSEQDHNLTRELERLRNHLAEMEESYTQELMTSEQKLTECQTRLHSVEERAKQTSTVYTSNSIRANQEVETLRNQIKLLEKQREDAQAKLGEAEDSRSRSEAALTNLQVVLEQFQLDKERDIQIATEKIRKKMEDNKSENSALQEEIQRLNKKLEEAMAGLHAATRLGDQVETKTAMINDLKEQVRTLQQSVAASKQTYHNATSNQQDKVDKHLVKNLVINYVVAASQNNTNKTQVLRILSTVLDLNQQECERLGLVRGAAPDSFTAEFVKFLENESKPRPPMPNMMGITQGAGRSSTPSSRRSSTLGPQPIFESTAQPGHSRHPSTGSNNLLFQHIDADETSSQMSIDLDTDQPRRNDSFNTLRSDPSIPRFDTLLGMDTGVNQTRNTEGAILKSVLKDM